MKLNTIKEGRLVSFYGNLCVVLEHFEDGTTLLMDTNYVTMLYGDTNNFAFSIAKEKLNSSYLDIITAGHPNTVIPRVVDLTALNGSKEYGTVTCKVAPLTFDEVRKYYDILPLPEIFEWTATPWSTPHDDEEYTWIVGLDKDGNIKSDDFCSDFNTRPAFLVSSNYEVE